MNKAFENRFFFRCHACGHCTDKPKADRRCEKCGKTIWEAIIVDERDKADGPKPRNRTR
jgi:rRNA maturation endonuclease Nob1